MQTYEIIVLIVTILIFLEVSYLLAKLPKTSIKSKDRAILVDTSVLMDGRIIGIAATSFIGGTLVVPRSVIGELQFLADHADSEKRARARSGLDVVRELQTMETVEVEILQDGSKASEGVDERLLNLAKQHSAVICTLDYNLNKVAVVEGITVLNINELAQSLRLVHLPGDSMVIELVQKGQDAHQAVGYMPDGTMVVVEQSSSLIGQKVQVEVVRSLQTAAGKMMFARRVDHKKPVSTAKQSAPVAQVAKSTKTAGRAPKPQKPAKQPKQEQGEKTHAQPHNDQKHAQKPHKQPHRVTAQLPQASVNPRQSAAPQPSGPVRQQQRPANRRKRVDREAELIKLVDSQSK